MSSPFASMTFEDILDDLSSRFIINVPAEESSSIERICFQIEQAHWFYEDFVREQNPQLPSFSLKNFASLLFHHCPLLRKWSHKAESAFNKFIKYKVRVPVCGAILINDGMDKVLLVKGWSNKSGWTFPKGKINKDEPEIECAIRESIEETGFDISSHIHSHSQDYIEITLREQRIRLYIIYGVSEETLFVPKTRKEISALAWFPLVTLPAYQSKKGNPQQLPVHPTHQPRLANYLILGDDMTSKTAATKKSLATKPPSFYMVAPFASKLRQWLKKKKRNDRYHIPGPIQMTEHDTYNENEHENENENENEPEQYGYFGGHESDQESIKAFAMTDQASESLKRMLGIGGYRSERVAVGYTGEEEDGGDDSINNGNLLQKFFPNIQSPPQQFGAVEVDVQNGGKEKGNALLALLNGDSPGKQSVPVTPMPMFAGTGSGNEPVAPKQDLLSILQGASSSTANSALPPMNQPRPPKPTTPQPTPTPMEEMLKGSIASKTDKQKGDLLALFANPPAPVVEQSCVNVDREGNTPKVDLLSLLRNGVEQAQQRQGGSAVVESSRVGEKVQEKEKEKEKGKEQKKGKGKSKATQKDLLDLFTNPQPKEPETVVVDKERLEEQSLSPLTSTSRKAASELLLQTLLYGDRGEKEKEKDKETEVEGSPLLKFQFDVGKIMACFDDVGKGEGKGKGK